MPELRATYRLQFHRGFNLLDAHALVDYFARLGISHLYASPLLCARHGSRHGYDITDPTRLNPEIGTEAELGGLARLLGRRQMGLLADIVPNHMAASVENPWWRDVLQRGPHSRYAAWFDIDWSAMRAPGGGRVLLPIVAGSVGRALERREFRLEFDPDGLWYLRFQEEDYPLALSSYPLVAEGASGELAARSRGGDRQAAEVEAALDAVAHAGADADGSEELAARMQATLRQAYERSPRFRQWMELCLRRSNRSPRRLARLLGRQYYQSANWKEANRSINYRRFFAVNDLVAFRVGRLDAFAASHSLVRRWLRRGWVEALRVDHIDGLADPLRYLKRLAGLFRGGEPAVLVEKILAYGEALPADWPVLGTTGYEFMAALDRLQTPAEGGAAVVQLYERFLQRAIHFADVAYGKKLQVAGSMFRGEMKTLGERLRRLAAVSGAPARAEDEAATLLSALAAGMGVYRTYARRLRLSRAEQAVVSEAAAAARERVPGLPPAGLRFARWVLSCDARARVPRAWRSEWLSFLRRWQQYTAPIMAKGVEDSAFYIYVALPAHCEVGHSPDVITESRAAFHLRMRRRQREAPLALNATSTHDTKRSEDVRARLNALAEMPTALAQHLARWARWNAPHRRVIRRRPAPGRNVEYLYYQTLLGTWPADRRSAPGEDYTRRLSDYMLKAVREARVDTSWEMPDADYEAALNDFVLATLDEARAPRFLADLRIFVHRLAPAGALNSLVQVALKIVLPGVPDFYQGCELWNFSLVDPDNRRSVDFALRRRVLADLDAAEAPVDDVAARQRTVRELLRAWRSGAVKLWLISRLLRLRERQAELFTHGDYRPVAATGSRAEHVLAFVRRLGAQAVLTVVPLGVAAELPEPVPDVAGLDWGDTRLLLPGAGRTWRSVLTGAAHGSGRAELSVEALLRDFPIAVLEAAG